jgi:hypothetical protein
MQFAMFSRHQLSQASLQLIQKTFISRLPTPPQFLPFGLPLPLASPNSMVKSGRKLHHIPPLHHVLDLCPLVNLVNQF